MSEQQVTVYADGGSRGNPGPAGYGSVVFAADGSVLAERAGFLGRATNNVAEYSGLIAGLTAAAQVGATTVVVRMDSKLVVEQMSGRWKVKHPDMKPLAQQAAALVRQFRRVRFEWVPRADNSYADRLGNEAMDAGVAGDRWQGQPDRHVTPDQSTPASAGHSAVAPPPSSSTTSLEPAGLFDLP